HLAEVVEGARHHLLPGATLAGDEDRGLRRGDLLDQVEDLPHGAARADEPREVVVRVDLAAQHLLQSREVDDATVRRIEHAASVRGPVRLDSSVGATVAQSFDRWSCDSARPLASAPSPTPSAASSLPGEPMRLTLRRFLNDERFRLEALLADTFRSRGEINHGSYTRFRAALLRRVAVDKLILPALERARAGKQRPSAARLELGHVAATSVLVPPPTLVT